MVQEPDELEEDEPTRVIFSLIVNSGSPIAALAHFPARTRAPRPDDDYFYDIFHAEFEDDNWNTRSDKLDAAVNDALDLLDASGVDPDGLAAPGVHVRAFFTFDPGAETIQASVVKRLAGYNAAIWIDANR
ncbi:MAG TPA: hypothetical protein VGM94_13690 [Galbitalea sp.]